MAIRTIVKKGDPALSKVCKPVTDFGKRTSELLDDLTDTLEYVTGLGLAAPQVGILRRACIVVRNDESVLELVNPEILARGEEKDGAYEGCLSVPAIRGWVERPTRVIVRAMDREGQEFTVKLEGMEARAAQHEIDHLDGHLFIEKSTKFIKDESLV